MSFQIKLQKNRAQDVVTIKKEDTQTITAPIVAAVYSGGTLVNTYTLAGSEPTELITNGRTDVLTVDLLGATYAVLDGWYTVHFSSGNGQVSDHPGVGITLEATKKVYSKQGLVNVYAHKYLVDENLHVCHVMLSEMNLIETIDVAYQKQEDFDMRHGLIKEMLNYE
jgi:hypothetical protein